MTDTRNTESIHPHYVVLDNEIAQLLIAQLRSELTDLRVIQRAHDVTAGVLRSRAESAEREVAALLDANRVLDEALEDSELRASGLVASMRELLQAMGNAMSCTPDSECYGGCWEGLSREMDRARAALEAA